MTENRVRHFMVGRREMVYLKFVMEAHEGLATLSTADKLEGIVRLSYDPAAEPTVQGLVEALQQEIPMREVSRGTEPLSPNDSGLR